VDAARFGWCRRLVRDNDTSCNQNVSHGERKGERKISQADHDLRPPSKDGHTGMGFPLHLGREGRRGKKKKGGEKRRDWSATSMPTQGKRGVKSHFLPAFYFVRQIGLEGKKKEKNFPSCRLGKGAFEFRRFVGRTRRKEKKGKFPRDLCCL